jgi:hypothetical protein
MRQVNAIAFQPVNAVPFQAGQQYGHGWGSIVRTDGSEKRYRAIGDLFVRMVNQALQRGNRGIGLRSISPQRGQSRFQNWRLIAFELADQKPNLPARFIRRALRQDLSRPAAAALVLDIRCHEPGQLSGIAADVRECLDQLPFHSAARIRLRNAHHLVWGIQQIDKKGDRGTSPSLRNTQGVN